MMISLTASSVKASFAAFAPNSCCTSMSTQPIEEKPLSIPAERGDKFRFFSATCPSFSSNCP